jgi:hypothetical protein
MQEHSIKWNYPWNGQIQVDLVSGLTKVGYQTQEPYKRIACFFSHYLLWKEVVESDEPMMIFEHDAIFDRHLGMNELLILDQSRFDIIALNEPQRGHTPLANVYSERVRKTFESENADALEKGEHVSQGKPVGVPSMTDESSWQGESPSGLPGNSAYYIKPAGARKLLSLVKELGAWPNDAIMCRQLMPGKLGIFYPYITKIQDGLKSSTTL